MIGLSNIGLIGNRHISLIFISIVQVLSDRFSHSVSNFDSSEQHFSYDE